MLSAPLAAWAGKQNAAPQGPSAQDQQQFTSDYWAARDGGPDKFNKFQEDVKNLSDPQQYKDQMTMLNNLNNGKGADGGEAKGFHGDASDSGPTDWSQYDIQTDKDGNITGFKHKDFDQIDTDHDGKLSEDELKAWRKKQDEENKKKGGPPGFRPPPPPPGVGPGGKLLPGFSLTCFECTKRTYVAPKEDIRCHGSAEGACTQDACPSDQACEQYEEKTDDGKQTYFCHNCEEKPPVADNCENHGLTSSGTCDGKCEGQGDQCVPLDLDLSSGQVLRGNSTREQGLKTITCFECRHSGYYNPLISQMCEKDGYFGNSGCDGKCPADDCEAFAVDNQTHQPVSGTSVDANQAHTCYRCKEHYTSKIVCPAGAVVGNCPGSCPSDQDCTAVAAGCAKCSPKHMTATGEPPTNTTPVSPGTNVKPSACDVGSEGTCSPNPCPNGGECKMITKKSNGAPADCYMCKESSTVRSVCPEGSVAGTCPGACSSDQECISVSSGCAQCAARHMTAVKKKTCEDMGMTDGESCAKSCVDKGGSCVQKSEDDYGTKCWECQEHKIAMNLCPKGAQLGPCPGSCGSMDECIPLPGQCYQCKVHSIAPVRAAQSCPLYDGYYNDPSCGGTCSADNCIAQTIDSKTFEVVPANRTQAHPVQTCYTCKMPYREFQDNCYRAGYYSDPYCEDDCPESACDEFAISKSTLQPVSAQYAHESGDVFYCYDCISYEKWLQRVKMYHYLILLVEPPYERFVLNRTAADAGVFQPSSVMALAKVDDATGKIPNVSGNLQAITSFVGGLNAGFGPGGITTSGSVTMPELSGALEQALKKGGDFGQNCFGDVQNQADKQAAASGNPTSRDISEGKAQKDEKGKSDESFSQDAIKASEDADAPAVSGPVIACGTQNKQKVLQILDSSGNLVASITQDMLKGNPSIILQKLGVAQKLTDGIWSGQTLNLNALAMKLGQFLKPSQPAKAEVIPNDPLYPKPKAAKKKASSFLFGLIGGGENINPAGNNNALSETQTADMVNNGDGITDQYYLPLIGYTPLSDPNSAWNTVDAQQPNVLVALVDSGLDLKHPDAPQYIWTDPKTGAHGWNFVNENTDLTDYRGHGTFVAGVVAAKWNNGIGIAGINPGAVILPVKVTDDKGKTSSLAIYRGINYAVDRGAKIINVSLGGVTVSRLEQMAIARAHAKGALVVLAAGNTADNLMNFGPSSSKYGLAVGMTDLSGNRSIVSSWGANMGLMAPGEKIISLCSRDAKDVLPSIKKYGYFKLSGTSFSAPMVTATASLMLAKNPHLTADQIAEMIEKTAKPLKGQEWDDQTGFGLLDAAAALRANVDDHVLVMVTNLHFNRDVRGRLTTLDVYGTVKGSYKEMTIEAGRGKQPLGFNTIAGPFHDQFDHRLIARLIIHDVLRGSDEWVLKLKVIGADGKEHAASTHFVFPNK